MNKGVSREGFTADVCGKLIQRTLLSHWKTLPLVLLAQFTSDGRQFAQQHPILLHIVQVLAFLAVLRRLNAWVNQKILNNGVSDQYDWSREVVVLTGGSNGIGRQIARLLAKGGITVAILDIEAPSKETEDGGRIHYYECDIF